MKSLLFTFLSLFIIAELAVAQSSGYSNVSNGESSKANKTQTSTSNSRIVNDSLKQIALTAEIEAFRKQLKAQSDANQAQMDQLKAKSESNQSQIDQLKVDNARTKIAGTVNRPIDNTLVIGQLKAQSDSNQVQIDHLKAELAKAKDTEAAIAQLKARSESNQSQIDQLKVDNARTKIAGTVNRPTDNTLVIGQLKAQSDTNQAQIGQLKRELSKDKEAETAIENSRRSKDSALHHFLISETDALLTQLKIKSDTNQVQFERLKADLENSKTAKRTPGSNKDNDGEIAQLKAKSETYQTQIDQLKEELAKAKEVEKARKSNDSLALVNSQGADVKLALLKTKSESNQAQIDQLKVDNARIKIAGTLTSPVTDNTVVIGQLKVKSDSNQAQIDRLKTELAKVKNVEVKPASNAEYGELIAKLKIQSENNQAQIDLLVEAFLKSKEDVSKSTNSVNSTKAASVDKQVLGVRSIEKSNSTAEIAVIDPELEKTKKSELSQPIPVVAIAGLPSSKSNGFVDEKGALAGNGFYIVIGTFGNKENAEKFKAATIIKGHRDTKIIQNKITKMYNIFALKTNNKKDADLERAKYKGEYSNVWILNLE